jgi:hypothetical protein
MSWLVLEPLIYSIAGAQQLLDTNDVVQSELPSWPCHSRFECGIVHVAHARESDDSQTALGWMREALASIRQLKHVSAWLPPIALIRNELAWQKLRELATSYGADSDALWDVHLNMTMHPLIAQAIERGRASPGASTRLKSLGTVGRAWIERMLFKFSSRLLSPFERTLFLDLDVFVIDRELVRRLLMQTARLADVALPIHPYRERFWASAAAPSICAAIIVTRRNADIDQLWVGAAERMAGLCNFTGVANLTVLGRMGEQASLWFQWVHAQPWLRVLVLPEETYCPGPANIHRWQERRPMWSTGWHRSSKVMACKAVHGHDVKYEQLWKQLPMIRRQSHMVTARDLRSASGPAALNALAGVYVFTVAFERNSTRFGSVKESVHASLHTLRHAGVAACDVMCDTGVCAALRSVDGARLHVYDEGQAPGPLAGWSWVGHTDMFKLQYMLRVAPAGAALLYVEMDMLFLSNPLSLIGKVDRAVYARGGI